MRMLATWIYAHLAWLGVALLAANTTFQKLPIAEQDDLIDLVGRASRWIWKGIVSRLSPSEQGELSDEMKALIASVVKAEMAKNGPGATQN